MRQDIEEIYIDGYIIRRVSDGPDFCDETLFIENTETGENMEVSEEKLGLMLYKFWRDSAKRKDFNQRPIK